MYIPDKLWQIIQMMLSNLDAGAYYEQEYAELYEWLKSHKDKESNMQSKIKNVLKQPKEPQFPNGIQQVTIVFQEGPRQTCRHISIDQAFKLRERLDKILGGY